MPLHCTARNHSCSSESEPQPAQPQRTQPRSLVTHCTDRLPMALMDSIYYLLYLGTSRIEAFTGTCLRLARTPCVKAQTPPGTHANHMTLYYEPAANLSTSLSRVRGWPRMSRRRAQQRAQQCVAATHARHGAHVRRGPPRKQCHTVVVIGRPTMAMSLSPLARSRINSFDQN